MDLFAEWPTLRDSIVKAAPCGFLEASRAVGSIGAVQAMVAVGVVREDKEGIRLVDPDAAPNPFEAMVAVALRNRDGIVCMESAAWIHGLTDVPPDAVHMAFCAGKNLTGLKGVHSLWPRRWTNFALEVGVETENVCGHKLRVTNRARTVLDIATWACRPDSTQEMRDLAVEVLARYTETAPVFKKAVLWAREHAGTPAIPALRAG
jgi:hypothetical protein